MTVLIKITTGLDSELFNLFSDVDGFSLAFETGLPKSFLIEGYSSIFVPDNTSIVRVVASDSPAIYVDTPVNSIADFNFTSKIPQPPGPPLT